jgi:hypothetical protein
MPAVAKDVKKRTVLDKSLQAQEDLPTSRLPESHLGAQLDEALEDDHLLAYRESPEQVREQLIPSTLDHDL